MQDIEKALRELEKAVKSNTALASVTVTIRLKKPTPSKATTKPKKATKKA